MKLERVGRTVIEWESGRTGVEGRFKKITVEGSHIGVINVHSKITPRRRHWELQIFLFLIKYSNQNLCSASKVLSKPSRSFFLLSSSPNNDSKQ